MAWSRQSRHARGYGTEWERLRVAVLQRDKGLCRCAECQRTGRIRVATEVDHVVPKAKGGTDDWDNLSAIHAECHAKKTLADKGQRRRRSGCDVNGEPLDPHDGWKRDTPKGAGS